MSYKHTDSCIPSKHIDSYQLLAMVPLHTGREKFQSVVDQHRNKNYGNGIYSVWDLTIIQSMLDNQR